MTLQDLSAYLKELNTASIVFRMVLAILCGGIIGLERERKRRPAGFRTHMLVCLGSALVMMISHYILLTFGPGTDPARLGAQVISGIGFLGAGTILVTGRQQVKGLTTAAGLWASACMGLAIGIGFYGGALIACAAIVAAMFLLDGIDRRIAASSRHVTLYIEFDRSAIGGAFFETLRAREIKVGEIEISRNHMSEGGDSLTVVVALESRRRIPHAEILSLVATAEGVARVEEI